MDERQSEAIQENKMGVLPIGKLLVSMAIPMMISMMFQALYNVVDSIFVARIGQDAMNAVSLAFPLQMLMIAVSTGTGVGINALLSRSLGEKKQEVVDRTANTAVFLALASTLVFFLAGLFLSRPFFLAQTENPNIVELGTQYATICMGASIGLFVQICCEKLLQSTGRMSLSMTIQILGAGTNIILDPILIFGLFGAPEWGVAGAAVATVVGQILASLVGIFFNLRFNPEIHIRLREIRPHGATTKEIYKIGVPAILMQSVGSVMIFCMNRILITFTEAATAVFGAYFKLQSFVFMPVFGLTNGMVPIVSYNFGAARMDRVKRTIHLCFRTAVCIMLAGMILFELAPDILLGFFSPSDEMLSIGRVALRIIAIHFPIAGFCIVASSVFQALGTPVYSLINAICRQLVVLIPVAWLLGQSGRLELVWFAFPIAELVSLISSSIFMRRTMRSAELRLQGKSSL